MNSGVKRAHGSEYVSSVDAVLSAAGNNDDFALVSDGSPPPHPFYLGNIFSFSFSIPHGTYTYAIPTNTVHEFQTYECGHLNLYVFSELLDRTPQQNQFLDVSTTCSLSSNNANSSLHTHPLCHTHCHSNFRVSQSVHLVNYTYHSRSGVISAVLRPLCPVDARAAVPLLLRWRVHAAEVVPHARAARKRPRQRHHLPIFVGHVERGAERRCPAYNP